MALGQPAYQSSTSQSAYATRAVDGIAHGVFGKGSCTHTEANSNPWWAVDLGTQRLVYEIQVANRVNDHERLCNFTVGLTHTQPTKTNGPDKSPHQECLFYSGAFPATRLTLTCNKPTWGRYLFIQINASQHVLTLCEVEVYYYFDTSVIEMTGYRNDYNFDDVTDLNNATCQQVTTPESDEAFRLRVHLPTAHKHVTLTAVLDGGQCLDFPATMVYTEGDGSVLAPYQNNPVFCDNQPGKCVFECDCSDMPCQYLYLVVLSAPYRQRDLCEIFVTW
ncbi:hypothetical protein NP493_74g05060 [Ridgeia piscesae]|uniref:Fucolectin tachylectin-4 pentraxin-1 domain-containing protein n=1 Tax=Ridgeia piscesae TaxID=27915 RepID=A0AAD9UIE7_RIDPI|nr:hypothetical protein NP493_74g05060 [Ridgeia piscesae]